jgi:hypothetical protein
LCSLNLAKPPEFGVECDFVELRFHEYALWHMPRAGVQALSLGKTSSIKCGQIAVLRDSVSQNRLAGYNFQSSAQPLAALGPACLKDGTSGLA